MHAALEALEPDAGTDRGMEILQLQLLRKKADDPRRGGKTRYTESVGSTIRESSDETDNTLEVKEYQEACKKPDEQKEAHENNASNHSGKGNDLDCGEIDKSRKR